MANGIIKYTSKDYTSIKDDLIDSISSLTGLWTSREDSDPGIVLLKCMSALGDMLSYNFDKQALEYYAPTVSQRKNASRLFDLIGYHMHWYQSALTTVTLTYTPTMPEYIQLLKDIKESTTDEELYNAYYAYRNKYRYDVISVDPHIISLSAPPILSATQIPLPQSMIDAGVSRKSVNVGTEGTYPDDEPLPYSIKDNTAFKENAVLFKEAAKIVFDFWIQDIGGPIGIHTAIDDTYRTLELYPNDSSSLVYSLLPETENVSIVNGEYQPTLYLYPFEPKSFSAIQGSLKSTTFTKSQLKKNKFYIPESTVDDTYMYVSYITTDTNLQQQRPIFLRKTDNLLTTTEIKDPDTDKTIIYFQFGVDDFDYPYIELSSYWSEELPEDGVTFTFYYFKTQGKYGNITNNYLTSLSSYNNANIVVSNIDTNISEYNDSGDLLSKPGLNPETAYDAYINSLNYIQTYNTLVTIYDFERYTNRQHGISNSLAVDKQRLRDLNTAMQKECMSYTVQQLQDILGVDTADKNTMINQLCNIRKVVYTYSEAPITKENATGTYFDTDDDTAKTYTLHMYPVYSNFELSMKSNDQPVQVASMTNYINGLSLPYYIYKINTSDDSANFPLEKMLDDAYRDCQIVNVEPSYTGLRVFPWRCCGVLHLTKSVSKLDARNIVENVIKRIKSTYTANKITFGQKIKYIDLIQVITNSDTRIRYFDAGIGNRKLIQFQNTSSTPENFFDAEAYFNKESLMMYVQSIDENFDENSEFYNWISVDTSYIQY